MMVQSLELQQPCGCENEANIWEHKFQLRDEGTGFLWHNLSPYIKLCRKLALTLDFLIIQANKFPSS